MLKIIGQTGDRSALWDEQKQIQSTRRTWPTGRSLRMTKDRNSAKEVPFVLLFIVTCISQLFVKLVNG